MQQSGASPRPCAACGALARDRDAAREELAAARAVWAAEKAEQEGMKQQVGSPENVEAITAFMEKRKPDFRKLR